MTCFQLQSISLTGIRTNLIASKHARGTLRHILSACLSGLSSDLYTWRHNNVLKVDAEGQPHPIIKYSTVHQLHERRDRLWQRGNYIQAEEHLIDYGRLGDNGGSQRRWVFPS